MKARLFVGFSVIILVVAVLVYSAKAYQDPIQGKPPAVDEYKHPLGYVDVGTPPPQPVIPPPQPSLSEMIANLKELRKQEQQLAKAIQQKFQEQKKTLDDAEKELNSMGIGPSQFQDIKPISRPEVR